MLSAIVTGGSGDIGRAICTSLAEHGYAVAVCYNTDSENAETTASLIAERGGVASAVHCDVTDEQQIKDAVKAAASLGDLRVVVNCSGISLFSQIQDTTAADLERVFAVNSTGTYMMCREAVRYMIPLGCGRIINISSMWGVSGGSCESAYSASKASVIGLTKALAKELGPSGITVNCIAPGVIDTKMNARLSEDDLQVLRDETPVCRIGTPDDVAQAVTFFAEAPFVTGQILSVDGGFTL